MMKRPLRAPRALLALLAMLAVALVLLASPPARAKFSPPPLTSGHVVTTGGWLAPADIRTLNAACELLHSQTGYVLDVLVVGSLEGESIQAVADEVFQAWKPGDPGKDNGLLLVFAPNFPEGERKVRLSVGKGVGLSEAKARSVLLGTIEPRINSSDVRGAVASGVAELARVLGGDVERVTVDGGADGGSAAPASAAPRGAAAESGSSWGLVAFGVAIFGVVAAAAWYVRSRGKAGAA